MAHRACIMDDDGLGGGNRPASNYLLLIATSFLSSLLLDDDHVKVTLFEAICLRESANPCPSPRSAELAHTVVPMSWIRRD